EIFVEILFNRNAFAVAHGFHQQPRGIYYVERAEQVSVDTVDGKQIGHDSRTAGPVGNQIRAGGNEWYPVSDARRQSVAILNQENEKRSKNRQRSKECGFLGSLLPQEKNERQYCKCYPFKRDEFSDGEADHKESNEETALRRLEIGLVFGRRIDVGVPCR